MTEDNNEVYAICVPSNEVDIKLTPEEVDEAFEIIMTEYDKSDLANWIIELTPNSGIKEILENHRADKEMEE